MNEENKVSWKNIVALTIAFTELVAPYFLIAMIGIEALMYLFSKM